MHVHLGGKRPIADRGRKWRMVAAAALRNRSLIWVSSQLDSWLSLWVPFRHQRVCSQFGIGCSMMLYEVRRQMHPRTSQLPEEKIQLQLALHCFGTLVVSQCFPLYNFPCCLFLAEWLVSLLSKFYLANNKMYNLFKGMQVWVSVKIA